MHHFQSHFFLQYLGLQITLFSRAPLKSSKNNYETREE